MASINSFFGKTKANGTFDLRMSANRNRALFGTICHEFQHYMDKLSMGSSDEWVKTYTENVDFYEMKAIQFGRTKSKELLKLM